MCAPGRDEAGLGMAMQGWARLAQAAEQPNQSYKHSLGVFGSVRDAFAPLLSVIQVVREICSGEVWDQDSLPNPFQP